MKNPPKVALGLSTLIFAIGFNICESTPFLIAPTKEPLLPEETLKRNRRNAEEPISTPAREITPKLSWAERHKDTRLKVADIEKRVLEERVRRLETGKREAEEKRREERIRRSKLSWAKRHRAVIEEGKREEEERRKREAAKVPSGGDLWRGIKNFVLALEERGRKMREEREAKKDGLEKFFDSDGTRALLEQWAAAYGSPWVGYFDTRPRQEKRVRAILASNKTEKEKYEDLKGLIMSHWRWEKIEREREEGYQEFNNHLNRGIVKVLNAAGGGKPLENDDQNEKNLIQWVEYMTSKKLSQPIRAVDDADAFLDKWEERERKLSIQENIKELKKMAGGEAKKDLIKSLLIASGEERKEALDRDGTLEEEGEYQKEAIEIVETHLRNNDTGSLKPLEAAFEKGRVLRAEERAEALGLGEIKNKEELERDIEGIVEKLESLQETPAKAQLVRKILEALGTPPNPKLLEEMSEEELVEETIKAVEALEKAVNTHPETLLLVLQVYKGGRWLTKADEKERKELVELGGEERERAQRRAREAGLLETKSPFQAIYKGRKLPVWRECIGAGIGARKHPCQVDTLQTRLPGKMYFWKRGYYDEKVFGKKYFSVAWAEPFEHRGGGRYTRVEQENVGDNILEARNNLWKQRKSFELPLELINSFKKPIRFRKAILARWGEAQGEELVNFYEVFGEEYFKEALYLALILTHNFLDWKSERKGGDLGSTFSQRREDLLEGQFAQKRGNLWVGIEFATVEDFLRYIGRHIKLDLSELEDPFGPQYVNIVDNFNIRDLLQKSYYKPGPGGW